MLTPPSPFTHQFELDPLDPTLDGVDFAGLIGDPAQHTTLVRHPNVPEDLFWTFAHDMWWEALHNPALPFWLTSLDPDRDRALVATLARMSAYPDARPALAAWLAGHLPPQQADVERVPTILWLLASPYLPRSFVAQWADPDNLPTDVAHALKDIPPIARHHHAYQGMPDQPPEPVRFLEAFDTRIFMRYWSEDIIGWTYRLALTGLFPKGALEVAADHGAVTAFMGLSVHPQVDAATQRAAAHYVKSHTNLRRPHWLAHARRAPSELQRVHQHVATHAIPPSDAHIATLLACAPMDTLPPVQQHALARHPLPTIRAFLAQRPDLPAWMRELLRHDGDTRVAALASQGGPA